MHNPFNHPAFSMAALTTAINILPNRYGRLEDLTLMPAKAVRQRQIIVEEMNGVLNLLPTLPPGAPGSVGMRGKRKLRSFVIAHIPHDDVVLPEEVQGIRAFGSQNETEAVAGVIARHLETMRNKHAITLEHLRMGALKGVILDADGSVLYNLFDEFGIPAQSIAYDLNSATSNVKAKCLATLAAIEDNLKGEFMNSVHCLCSPEFFAALTTHAKVEKAFEQWQQGAILIGDVRRGFTYAGITFEEYRGQASDINGTVRRFIAAGEAHAFPLGTVDTFATYFAPADFNETVNTLGQVLYAKQEPRKFDRGDGSAHPVQSLTDVSSPRCVDQVNGVLMRIEDFYQAAQNAGLLTPVQSQGKLTHCLFRAPDETVLDGLALSRKPQIDYPASVLTLALGDSVHIHGICYQVRDVRILGDGTECRASLSSSLSS